LLGVTIGADAAPTQTQIDTVDDVQRSLAKALVDWDETKTQDIPSLNDQLRSCKLPAIDPALTAEPETEIGGDDEP